MSRTSANTIILAELQAIRKEVKDLRDEFNRWKGGALMMRWVIMPIVVTVVSVLASCGFQIKTPWDK